MNQYESQYKQLDEELFEIANNDKYRNYDLYQDYWEFVEEYDRSKSFDNQCQNVKQLINKIRNVKKG